MPTWSRPSTNHNIVNIQREPGTFKTSYISKQKLPQILRSLLMLISENVFDRFSQTMNKIGIAVQGLALQKINNKLNISKGEKFFCTHIECDYHILTRPRIEILNKNDKEYPQLTVSQSEARNIIQDFFQALVDNEIIRIDNRTERSIIFCFNRVTKFYDNLLSNLINNLKNVSFEFKYDQEKKEYLRKNTSIILKNECRKKYDKIIFDLLSKNIADVQDHIIFGLSFFVGQNQNSITQLSSIITAKIISIIKPELMKHNNDFTMEFFLYFEKVINDSLIEQYDKNTVEDILKILLILNLNSHKTIFKNIEDFSGEISLHIKSVRIKLECFTTQLKEKKSILQNFDTTVGTVRQALLAEIEPSTHEYQYSKLPSIGSLAIATYAWYQQWLSLPLYITAIILAPALTFLTEKKYLAFNARELNFYSNYKLQFNKMKTVIKKTLIKNENEITIFSNEFVEEKILNSLINLVEEPSQKSPAIKLKRKKQKTRPQISTLTTDPSIFSPESNLPQSILTEYILQPESAELSSINFNTPQDRQLCRKIDFTQGDLTKLSPTAYEKLIKNAKTGTLDIVFFKKKSNGQFPYKIRIGGENDRVGLVETSDKDGEIVYIPYAYKGHAG